MDCQWGDDMITIKHNNKFITRSELGYAVTLADFLRKLNLEDLCNKNQDKKYNYYLNSDVINLSDYIIDEGTLEIISKIKGAGGGGGGTTPTPTYNVSTSGSTASPTTFWVVLAPNQTNSGYPCPSLAADIKFYTGSTAPTNASTPIYTRSVTRSVPSKIGLGARLSGGSQIRNLKIYVTPITSFNPSNASINNFTPVLYNDSMTISPSDSQTQIDQVGHAYIGNIFNYDTTETI